MNKSRAYAATFAGALIGSAAGYLFFTEGGRRLRGRLEPAFEDFTREVMSFRVTMQKAVGMASEGWLLLKDAIGESDIPAPRFPGRQTSPF